MDMTFGPAQDPVCKFTNIAGYTIDAILQADGGIQSNLQVCVILRGTAADTIPSMPCWGNAFVNAEAMRQTLAFTGQAEYSFPGIELMSCHTIYSNRDQYHLLKFKYPENRFNPGIGQAAPEVAVTPGWAYSTSEVQAFGELKIANGAAIKVLGLEAYQQKTGKAGLKITSERCALAQHTGWLPAILELNKQINRTNPAANNPLTQFTLNSTTWNLPTAKGNQGLVFLQYEEYYRLGLLFPSSDLEVLCSGGPAALPNRTLRQLAFEVAAEKGGGVVFAAAASEVTPWALYNQALDPKGRGYDTTGKAVEVCSIIATTDEARTFDWRTEEQKGIPKKPEKK